MTHSCRTSNSPRLNWFFLYLSPCLRGTHSTLHKRRTEKETQVTNHLPLTLRTWLDALFLPQGLSVCAQVDNSEGCFQTESLPLAGALASRCPSLQRAHQGPPLSQRWSQSPRCCVDDCAALYVASVGASRKKRCKFKHIQL